MSSSIQCSCSIKHCPSPRAPYEIQFNTTGRTGLYNSAGQFNDQKKEILLDTKILTETIRQGFVDAVGIRDVRNICRIIADEANEEERNANQEPDLERLEKIKNQLLIQIYHAVYRIPLFSSRLTPTKDSGAIKSHPIDPLGNTIPNREKIGFEFAYLTADEQKKYTNEAKKIMNASRHMQEQTTEWKTISRWLARKITKRGDQQLEDRLYDEISRIVVQKDLLDKIHRIYLAANQAMIMLRIGILRQVSTCLEQAVTASGQGGAESFLPQGYIQNRIQALLEKLSKENFYRIKNIQQYLLKKGLINFRFCQEISEGEERFGRTDYKKVYYYHRSKYVGLFSLLTDVIETREYEDEQSKQSFMSGWYIDRKTVRGEIRYPVTFLQNELIAMKYFWHVVRQILDPEHVMEKYRELIADIQRIGSANLQKVIPTIENRIETITHSASKYRRDISTASIRDKSYISVYLPAFSRMAAYQHHHEISCHRRIALISIHAEESLRLERLASGIASAWGNVRAKKEEMPFLNKLKVIEELSFEVEEEAAAANP